MRGIYNFLIMNKSIFKISIISLYAASLVFFVLGLTTPIMKTAMFLGIRQQKIYLTNSIQYFYEEGEWFVGSLLLVFTIIFPILKYGITLLNILEINIKKGRLIEYFTEIISKWAMLDVFVVALVIINMKMESIIIVSKLQVGTTYFAVSILLLMLCLAVLKYIRDYSQ